LHLPKSAMVRSSPSSLYFVNDSPKSKALYKPILQEVEKILEEAGLDAEEMKKAAGGSGPSPSGISRNRR
jgi:hypothetical protein